MQFPDPTGPAYVTLAVTGEVLAIVHIIVNIVINGPHFVDIAGLGVNILTNDGCHLCVDLLDENYRSSVGAIQDVLNAIQNGGGDLSSSPLHFVCLAV